MRRFEKTLDRPEADTRSTFPFPPFLRSSSAAEGTNSDILTTSYRPPTLPLGMGEPPDYHSEWESLPTLPLGVGEPPDSATRAVSYRLPSPRNEEGNPSSADALSPSLARNEEGTRKRLVRDSGETHGTRRLSVIFAVILTDVPSLSFFPRVTMASQWLIRSRHNGSSRTRPFDRRRGKRGERIARY